MTKTRLLAPAFVLWEAYWAYVFISAPIPDVRMSSVFALLMGVLLPLVVAIPVVLYFVFKRLR